MLRRIVGWIVLVPLCLVLIVFALANRQSTFVSFNPLAGPDSAGAIGIAVPLFIVIFAFLLLGVILGGIASWFAQSRVRRERRRWQREVDTLRRRIETDRRGSAPARRPSDDLFDADDLVDSL